MLYHCVMVAVAVVLASCGKPDASQPDSAGPAPEPETPAAEASVETAEVPIGKVVDWEKDVDNPAEDGWESEVWAAAAKKQLEKLGTMLSDPAAIDSGAIDKLLAHGFVAGAPVPKTERVFEDSIHEVRRLVEPSPDEELIGSAEFSAALGELQLRSDGAIDRRCEFKVTEIAPSGDGFRTVQLVSFSWRTASEVVEQHATWMIEWQAGEPPQMRSLRVAIFEQSKTKLADGQALFSDCTKAVLGADPSYREQLLYGLNHWHERIPFRNSLNGLGTPGLSLGDVNGDGLEDLYFCQHPGLPNRLYLQDGDGTLREVSADWGVDWLDDSRCALIADFDNDGDQDLAVAILGHVVLAANHDNQRFKVEAVIPVMESVVSLAAADYDRDGLLDLYVGGYSPNTTTADAAPTAVGFGSDQFVYHDANNSIGNVMLRNFGGRKFSDVTAELGLDVNNRRWTLATAWEDFDDDGDPDLYVANDFGRNNLYQNDDGRFLDVAAEFGAEDSASGMSVSWGDYDRDGQVDLYVANMFSAAGNRIVPQAGFKPQVSGEVRRTYQRFARGNTLLRNLGDGFADTSVDAGVTMGRWAWSSLFADLNNDGWEDLVVANGHMTAEGDSGDL